MVLRNAPDYGQAKAASGFLWSQTAAKAVEDALARRNRDAWARVGDL